MAHVDGGGALRAAGGWRRREGGGEWANDRPQPSDTPGHRIACAKGVAAGHHLAGLERKTEVGRADHAVHNLQRGGGALSPLLQGRGRG